MIVQRDLAAAAQRAQQRETLLRRRRGKQRQLHVHAAGPLEIDLDQVRAARRQHPHDPAAVRGVAHLGGEHRVHPPAQAAVVAARIAPAKRLVGLVDEHVTAVQPVEQAEDFFEVALRAADPLVAEILDLDHRDARLARQAFDQIRLARADRPADEVTHRRGSGVARLPERDVLAQGVLHGGGRVEILQRAAGFDEFDQAAGLAFDEFFFQADEIGGAQWFAAIFLELDEIFDGRERRAGERGGQCIQLARELRERGGGRGGKKFERGVQFRGRRQRDRHAGDAWVVD